MSIDLVGRTLSHYRVLELLGVGGMGVVYRADDTRLRRAVALKFISNPLAQDPIAIEQFKLEARNASALNHPNICVVYEIGRWKDGPFIAMELLRGETLKQRLARGPIGAAAAAEIAVQIAKALDAAHSERIVHRDVKPANIFVSADGPIKLLDFGLAKQMPLADLDATLGRGFSEVGRILGTANYMAPERLRGRPSDHRSDLFSLGAVLYELVTGRQAFTGESVVDVIDAVLNDDPAPLDDTTAAAAKTLMPVIERLLRKEPERRYESASALAAAVTELRDDLASGRTSSRARATTWPRARASIAVLPFRNRDRNPDDDFIADGVAEGVIGALAKIDGLKVAAQASAFTLTDRNADLREIGERLKVDCVLYISTRRSGSQIRVTCRLARVVDESVIWHEQYDRDTDAAEPLFALQDDITRSIVDALKIGWTEHVPPMRRYTEVRDSLERYWMGRQYWAKRYSDGLIRAREEFDKAIAFDPQNALAYSGQADVYAFFGLYSLVKPSVAFDLAEAAAAKALDIDTHLPEVHTSVGLIALGRWKWDAAEDAFRRATRHRHQSLAHMYYAWLLALRNRSAEALIEMDQAQRIDPHSAMVNSGAGWMFFLMRQYAQAIAECEKFEDEDPNFLVRLYVKAMAFMRLGEYDRALPLIQQAAKDAKRTPFYVGLEGQAFAEMGRRAEVSRILTELDDCRAAKRYVPPHCYVYIYASLGDKDQAFAWQTQACEDGAPPFYFMSPAIASLHDDPRHRDHLARMEAAARAPRPGVFGSASASVST